MRLRLLDIRLGSRHVGQLFQWGEGASALTRFVPDEAWWRDPQAPLLSWATVVAPEARELFWSSHASIPFFNGTGAQLPPFFQNMLPEGALRRHLAQIRNCAIDDHFEILAACGTDLPGAVLALPADVSRDRVAAIVTQHHDALEVSVTADPIADATSLSGLQAKMSLVEQAGRYVARTRDPAGVHIIAKLPTPEFPLLPEVEDLSLRLAAAAGVSTCRASLAPLSAIQTDVPFTVGEARNFLAVERFDRRDGREHVHCEDFAQVLQVPPEMKYQDPNVSYALIARVLEAMGGAEAAVKELLRRLAVNEMLGNYDAHVKNFGVVYPDGRTPALAPAYDVVAYAAYLPGRGHALPFARGTPARARLGPASLRSFCNDCGMPETVASAVVRASVRAALDTWPDLIAASALLPQQKERLMAHFTAVPAVAALVRRVRSRKAPPTPSAEGPPLENP
ncbi:type II toxin-antitoxin system HipA family toxin [Ramlibacter sp. AN1015]|uniref:type II toxin-antitoxin system HipA family toxin n=1 Tax=Ramlibacter sp. AN1015 TaxID=3133428 RepID=UPI0030C1B785